MKKIIKLITIISFILPSNLSGQVEAQVPSSSNAAISEKNASSIVKVSEKQLSIINDSLVDIFYDKISKKSFRFFYNQLNERIIGKIKYPRDGEDKVEIPVLRGGVINEEGFVCNLNSFEEVLCTYDHRIVTRTVDIFKGNTILKSYLTLNNQYTLLDSLEFPNPYVYPIVVNDGKYILMIEGGDVNGNFVVFDYKLKYKYTYTPFIPTGFDQYDIESSFGVTTIACSHIISNKMEIKRAHFDDNFNLMQLDSLQLATNTSDALNYVSGFGVLHYRGNNVILEHVVPDGPRNKVILIGYGKDGKVIWESNLRVGLGFQCWREDDISFEWNGITKSMVSTLFDPANRVFPDLGVFDENKGRFQNKVPINDLMESSIANNEKIRITGLKWINPNEYLLSLGALVLRGKTIDFKDNQIFLISSKGVIQKIDSITEPIHKLHFASSGDMVTLITDKQKYEYVINR